MQQLDPKAVWLFFIRLAFTWIWFGVFLSFFVVGLVAGKDPVIEEGLVLDGVSIAIIIGIFALIIVASWIWAKLSWKFYRYELHEDGFRKELGIIWKKYTTIPYERIQNVDINRGLIARLLGLSDLNIQTAGSSAVYSRHGGRGLGAEGVLPGVSREKAEELRNELVRRAKSQRNNNQGL